MKKLNRSVAAMLIAASMSMTSCVKDEVSPEVKELRQAQVGYVKASADYQAALAKQQQVLADYNEANYAILTTKGEAQLEADLINIEKNVADAQKSLQDSEYLLAQATLKLEVYIAGLNNAEAKEYLTLYSTAAATLNNIAGQQIVKAADVAKAELILASVNAPWVVQKAVQEDLLAKEQGKLVAQEAALVALEAVADDPASANTKSQELSAQKEDLENANDALDVSIAEATAATTAANKKVTDANLAVTNHTTYTAELKSYNTQLEALNQSKVDKAAEITEESGILAAYNTNLTNSKTTLATHEAAYVAAKNDRDAKDNAVTVASQNLDIAINNNEANPTTENQNKVDAAQTALNAAQTALGTAQTKLNDAVADRDDAKAEVTSWTASVNGQQSTVDNLNTELATINTNIQNKNVEIVAKQAQIDAVKPAYDDAVANLEAYKTDVTVKAAVSAKLGVEKANNLAMYNNLTGVITSISTYLTNINSAIATKKTDIANTKTAIKGYEDAIAQKAVDKATQEQAVAVAKAQLAKLESEVAAQESIVAKYKALLDAALAQ